jgi:hypothetical protein
MDEPCELCTSRGFPCTADDKILAPSRRNRSSAITGSTATALQSTLTIPRPPSTPNIFILIDVETDYLYQQFYELKYLQPSSEDSWMPFQYLDVVRYIRKHVIIFHPPRQSPVVKAAQLTFASYAKDNGISIHTYAYLAAFFRHAKVAIENRDRLDLVYASYYIALFSLFSKDSLPSVQVNFLQFVRSVDATLENPEGILPEHLDCVESLWTGLVGVLFLLRRHVTNPITRLSLEKDNWSLLQLSRRLLPNDIHSWTVSRSNKQMRLKISTLTHVVTVRLNSFALQVLNNPCVKISPGGRHCNIHDARIDVSPAWEQILQITLLTPNVLDRVHQALSFGPSIFAHGDPICEDIDDCHALWKDWGGVEATYIHLLASMGLALVCPTVDFTDTSTSGVVNWAFGLCYLCTKTVHRPQAGPILAYSLLWAGIVLTKQRFPASEPLSSL